MAAFVVGALLAGSLVALLGRDDDGPEDSIAAGDGVEEVAAQLQQQEEERNKTEVVNLTGLAEQVVEDLTPVMAGLAAALPVQEGVAPQPADQDAVAGWRAAVAASADALADPPSAGTSISMARSGVATSVAEVGSAVDAYEAALAAPADQRERLLTLAATLRDRAVDIFATASVMLDQANIEYGAGHIHLSLPRDPGTPNEDAHVEPETSDGTG